MPNFTTDGDTLKLLLAHLVISCKLNQGTCSRQMLPRSHVPWKVEGIFMEIRKSQLLLWAEVTQSQARFGIWGEDLILAPRMLLAGNFHSTNNLQKVLRKPWSSRFYLSAASLKGVCSFIMIVF